jgi:hypothetical protein
MPRKQTSTACNSHHTNRCLPFCTSHNGATKTLFIQEQHIHNQTTLIAMAADPFIKFTLFPRLPAELRAKIWRQALFEERNHIIELRINNTAVLPAARPPTTFHVNQESRHESMMALPDCLSLSQDQEAPIRVHLQEDDVIYFSRDGLYRPPWYHGSRSRCWRVTDVMKTLALLASSLSEVDRAKIRHLAIEKYGWDGIEDRREFR